METLTPTDQSIVAEISGRLHLGVEGFFEKHFAHKPWSPYVEPHAQESSQKRPSSLQQFVLEFPSAVPLGYPDSVFLPQAPGSAVMAAAQSRSHAFLVPVEFSRNYTWAHVKVIGQFEEDPFDQDYLRGFLRLYADAQEVFTSQPTRLFLHGFYVFGSMVELWMFDRSGLYCCKPLDAAANLRQLMVTIGGYKKMSDVELGINTRIKKDDIGKYIMFKGDEEHEPSRLYLDDEPIVFPRKILSRQPTCYRARRHDSTDWQFVLKLSWQSEERSREEELLQMVKERKVWGVVQSFGHQQLDTISNLRQGLLFGVPQELHLGKGATPTEMEKMGAITRTSEDTNMYFIGARPASRKGPIDESSLSFEDLAFSCLVVFPLGHPLDKFDNTLEFLEACRDAVKGHRSLYLDGKILHQDISVGNIIISETNKPGEPRGIMIDLDNSMELAVGPRKQGELIGTKAFIAIDLLAGTPHTYRHDLESFLYVFLQVAICGGHKALPAESRLQRWLVGNWHVLSQKKTEDIEEEENFAAILSEFSPVFKGLEGLARGLRKVLFFPSSDGSFFVGTRHEPEEVQQLYEGVVGAFQAAIDSHTEKTAIGSKV